MSEEATRAGEAHAVRSFGAGDRTEYLDLMEAVFGDRPGDAWFDWKYVRNPYVDHVPIVVAERGDTLIGARSFFALPLRIGATRVSAFQACDTMVHPDHRRRGLFTRMTNHALAVYADAPPALSFNFPNEATLAGNRKLGWELVENLERYYRFRDPGRFIGSVPGPLTRGLEAGCRLYNGGREVLGTSPPPDVTVTRGSSVHPGCLAGLSRRDDLDRFHVPRDEEFYEWRYSRPDRRYSVFTAHRRGSPIGAAIVSDDGETARIMEVTPRMDRPEGVSAALFRAIVRTHGDAAVITTLSGNVEPGVLRSFGFLSGRNGLLTRLVGDRPFVVRPITGDEFRWDIEGSDLRDPSNWRLSFGDIDVA